MMKLLAAAMTVSVIWLAVAVWHASPRREDD